MLWISTENQTTKLEILGKIACKGRSRCRRGKIYSRKIDSYKGLRNFVGLLVTESCYRRVSCDIDNRKFMVQVLRFDNGNFVSITEGQEKIGGMLASIATEPVPSTTTIIPPKSESIFLKIMSDYLSSITKGINIVSAFIPQELDTKTTKVLMTKIKEIIEK